MKRLIALLLALVLILGLAACAQPSDEAPAEEPAETGETVTDTQETEDPAAETPEAPETVSFTDSVGRTVEVPGEIT